MRIERHTVQKQNTEEERKKNGERMGEDRNRITGFGSQELKMTFSREKSRLTFTNDSILK